MLRISTKAQAEFENLTKLNLGLKFTPFRPPEDVNGHIHGSCRKAGPETLKHGSTIDRAQALREQGEEVGKEGEG